MSAQPDVSTTLRDLERKLRDLERELAGVGSGARPSAPAPPRVAAPAPVQPLPPAPAPVADPALPPIGPTLSDPEAQSLLAEAKASLGGLHHQFDDLVRVRDELERSTRELMEEYSRVLDTFGAAPEPDPPLALIGVALASLPGTETTTTTTP